MATKRPRVQLVNLESILFRQKSNKPLKVSKSTTIKNKKKTTLKNKKNKSEKSIQEHESPKENQDVLFLSDSIERGSAEIKNNALTLTSSKKDQIGSSFSKQKIQFNDGFEVSFLFKAIGDADGFAFVITLDSSALGGGGGDLGYGGIKNGVLAIEFDSFRNDIYRDPPYNHVSIQVPDESNKLSCNHKYSISQFQSTFQNKPLNHCRIVYNRQSSEISVYITIDYNKKSKETKTIEKVEKVKLPNAFPTSAFFGFTGACGYHVQTTIITECIIKATTITTTNE